MRSRQKRKAEQEAMMKELEAENKRLHNIEKQAGRIQDAVKKKNAGSG